ncbi:MAG: IMP dehydrogenase [Candidatus Brockarchaeota archaeon]|nr:IMP dehydrogenase [Candidatus Brockarchaeota archaeon]
MDSGKPSITERFAKAQHAFTFRDFILLPGLTEVDPSEVDIETRVTTDNVIRVPFVSSPMDTVTEDEMAITLARLGGLGVIHRNCSTEEQVEMAKKVKRAESLVIRDVVTAEPGYAVREALALMRKYEISGLPVVKEGKLVGILTGRDVRFANEDDLVGNVMTKKVVTAHDNITLEQARELMHEHRIEKLPLVDESGKLKGLITFKDISLRGKYPNASRDKVGRLLCAAAASPFDEERCMRLDKVVDIIVFDVAHFHNKKVIDAARRLVKKLSANVVIGNIGTRQAALDVVSSIERVNALRAGIGSGSICITTEITKAGAPTLFAVAQAFDALKELGSDIPIWADGGITSPGDVALALAAGSSAVCIGNLFARTRESPGSLVAIGGQYYKAYRGMGSPSAMEKRHAIDRYASPSKGIAEGVEGYVPYKGDLATMVNELSQGLKASMGYMGAKNIREAWTKAQVAWVSELGATETKAHDVILPTRGPT